MSYQVLARKWRPNKFAELVGQDHVVTAISNALDNNRLHHAYLFTGTRGVGKTTIARIFSKSLNCEQGLSANPCGQCGTCKEIEHGNFIDLLEIDAASRTKVEDTRELLDNVQYKPSRGRYKVYLIDEVHMLSKHSFNALLKTLEEPPPHVKFLLATTDPQKLPVTILSRCLQFNLKALSRSQISQQLDYVLTQEQLPFEKDALAQLARAAQGSMRDALSLTDQAIAQGNGSVGLKIVTDMLGLMDKNQVLKLVHALVQKDSAKVMQQVENMAQQSADFSQILAEIMSLLHQVALTQFVPDACKLETLSARAIFQLAKTVPAELVQLLYQIALTGKKDLPFAADGRTGLEMTLLRMLSFCPDNLSLSAADIAEQTPAAKIIQQHSTSSQNQLIEPVELNEKATSEPVVSEPVSPPKVEQLDTISSENVDEPTMHITADVVDVPPELHEQNYPSDEDVERHLFEQQQGIIEQAQDFGHQPPEFFQPEANTTYEVAQPNALEPTATANSTADLIALRKKLQENQAVGEDSAQQVKKSEAKELPDLAAIRAQHIVDTQSSDDVPPKPQVQQVDNPPVRSLDSADTPTVNTFSHIENAPPWHIENGIEQQFSSSGDAPIPFNLGMAAAPESEADPFDPNEHLDEDNIGEVTLDVPAFLPNKQKVIQSMQLDDWSQLIEDMQITALVKQLALHSAFKQSDSVVTLTLLEGKEHLLSPSSQQLLNQALSSTLNTDIQLEIVMGQPINTPYAVQIKINQVRQEYACQTIESDQGIQLLKQRFDANVMENSIQAR